MDGLPPLLPDPGARATAADLLAGSQDLFRWFSDLDHASADRILRLDPQAWSILASFAPATWSPGRRWRT